MNILTAIILGAVQGITEFLPVSSSGHLVLLQKIFGIDEPALFFDTMLHVGTLTAVVLVLWCDIWAILKKIIQPLTLYVIIGTIPAVIFALLLKDSIESAFESGKFLGFAFITTAIILCVAEYLSKKGDVLKKDDEMNWLDAFIIGIMQAVAIIPGVSRSGATISGAISRKLNREFAARFSFLLSIPAILGAAVLQTKDIIKIDANETVINTGAVIAGTLTAAITGFFAVRFMIKIIKEKSLWGFAVYTGILGVLVLFDQYVSKFVNWL
ncbi:MAG: undecaprenyl-diphosphate phosphatase [Treponema sp.]|jgi:undecaprenyl-diphosphatase|nr:undecaprenyl-diphosphate phosphatase [Treponema sp.]